MFSGRMEYAIGFKQCARAPNGRARTHVLYAPYNLHTDSDWLTDSVLEFRGEMHFLMFSELLMGAYLHEKNINVYFPTENYKYNFLSWRKPVRFCREWRWKPGHISVSDICRDMGHSFKPGQSKKHRDLWSP